MEVLMKIKFNQNDRPEYKQQALKNYCTKCHSNRKGTKKLEAFLINAKTFQLTSLGKTHYFDINRIN